MHLDLEGRGLAPAGRLLGWASSWKPARFISRLVTDSRLASEPSHASAAPAPRAGCGRISGGPRPASAQP